MYTLNLSSGERAVRKSLITVAVWTEGNTSKAAILGSRTPESSIKLGNADSVTDILGCTRTDVDLSAPVQSFNPAYVLGGDELSAFLARSVLIGSGRALSGAFDIYVVAAFLTETAGDTVKYFTVKHAGCTIVPGEMGGGEYVALPFDVHYSGDITKGYVTDLSGSALLNIAANFTEE